MEYKILVGNVGVDYYPENMTNQNFKKDINVDENVPVVKCNDTIFLPCTQYCNKKGYIRNIVKYIEDKYMSIMRDINIAILLEMCTSTQTHHTLKQNKNVRYILTTDNQHKAIGVITDTSLTNIKMVDINNTEHKDNDNNIYDKMTSVNVDDKFIIFPLHIQSEHISTEYIQKIKEQANIMPIMLIGDFNINIKRNLDYFKNLVYMLSTNELHTIYKIYNNFVCIYVSKTYDFRFSFTIEPVCIKIPFSSHVPLIITIKQTPLIQQKRDIILQKKLKEIKLTNPQYAEGSRRSIIQKDITNLTKKLVKLDEDIKTQRHIKQREKQKQRWIQKNMKLQYKAIAPGENNLMEGLMKNESVSDTNIKQEPLSTTLNKTIEKPQQYANPAQQITTLSPHPFRLEPSQRAQPQQSTQLQHTNSLPLSPYYRPLQIINEGGKYDYMQLKKMNY